VFGVVSFKRVFRKKKKQLPSPMAASSFFHFLQF
jgi:hypothetical protein